MAGSYSHCLDDRGEFTFRGIDNMGDAREALAMMTHMIDSLSRRVAGDRSSQADVIRDAEANYYRSVNPKYDEGGPYAESSGVGAMRKKERLTRRVADVRRATDEQNYANALLAVASLLEELVQAREK